MKIRERLLEIPELNIQQQLVQMSNAQLDEYIQTLNSFVEGFPSKEKEIQDDLSANEDRSFFKRLISIKDMLISIHADELAEECKTQIDKLQFAKHEKIEAYTTYFLSTLAMLSIDIQMAVHADGEEETHPVEAVKDTEKSKADGKSILAVDDNTYFLDILKDALRDTEYHLACVTSGSAALRYLQNHRPDLYILDIEMPEMDGYQLARSIRSRGMKAPVIFLTGNASKEYVAKAVKAGAADFIIKPINKEHVQQRINKHIQTQGN
ncbi:MAG: response regulator [Tannerella sp.]|jgi:CheY-like chemotaxis protein|nr:response regulator [Tannerella sp.]